MNVPYVVETLVPLPTLPGANLPQLPQVNVQVPASPAPRGSRRRPGHRAVPPPATAAATPAAIQGSTGTSTRTRPVGRSAAVTGERRRRLGLRPVAVRRAGPLRRHRRQRGTAAAARAAWPALRRPSVPVFGQLAGLNGSGLDDQSAQRDASSAAPAQTLPAAALAAVVALAAVTAALVRTHREKGPPPPAHAAGGPMEAAMPRPSSPPGQRALVFRLDSASRRLPVDSAGGRPPHAGSLVLRVPATAGARNACTTLLLQMSCSRQDQRRWGFPCVITN